MTEPNRGGRPVKPEEHRRKRTISIRVSDGVYDELVRRQEVEGCVSLAQLVVALAIIGYTKTPMGGLRDSWRDLLDSMDQPGGLAG